MNRVCVSVSSKIDADDNVSIYDEVVDVVDHYDELGPSTTTGHEDGYALPADVIGCTNSTYQGLFEDEPNYDKVDANESAGIELTSNVDDVYLHPPDETTDTYLHPAADPDDDTYLHP